MLSGLKCASLVLNTSLKQIAGTWQQLFLQFCKCKSPTLILTAAAACGVTRTLLRKGQNFKNNEIAKIQTMEQCTAIWVLTILPRNSRHQPLQSAGQVVRGGCRGASAAINLRWMSTRRQGKGSSKLAE